MKINLKDVSLSKEQKICFDYTIDLSDEEVNFEKPFSEPVRISGFASEMSGVFRLEGEITAVLHTSCARCTREVKVEKRVPVSFILTQTPLEGEFDDILFVEGDCVDVDEVAMTELLLNMDIAVLCSEDCKGLCQRCGANMNDDPCGCEQKIIDPRLEKLAQLLNKD